jgi:hypothetical protein
MIKDKNCHGAKRIDESKLDLENKVKLIRLTVFYKHGHRNESEVTDYMTAIKTLTAFCDL